MFYVKDFVDKAQILKVKVLSKQDALDMQIEGADESTAAFKFVGTKNNIENAKALMDYLVTSHQELDTLQVSFRYYNSNNFQIEDRFSLINS